MSAERGGVAEAALQMRFVARVNEAVTDWQFAKVEENAAREGLIAYLGEGAATEPWTAYMDIMDGITAAVPLDDFIVMDSDAIPEPRTPLRQATLGIDFLGERERNRFQGLCEYAWSGIHAATMPRMRPMGPDALLVSGLSYPDISTLGRLGTIFLDRQYPELGRNRRLVITNRISEIEASGVMDYLPDDLLARIVRQRQDWGELADNMLLASGNLSVIGRALRETLGDTQPLEVQRHRSDLPHIEEGARFYPFYPTGSDIPISHITVGQKLMGQVVYEPFEELKAPFKQGRVLKGLIDLANMAWELGIKEGVVAGVFAIGTVIRAIGSAVISKIDDDRIRRQKGLHIILA